MADDNNNQEFGLDDEIINEFLMESKENTEKLDLQFIQLEENPHDKELLSSIFRLVHTLKGTSGFFNFKTLEGISHFGEDILSKLRDGLFTADSEIINALLEALDHIKVILKSLELTRTEGNEDHLEVVLNLKNISEKYTKRALKAKEEKTEVEQPSSPVMEKLSSTVKEQSSAPVIESVKEVKEITVLEPIPPQKENEPQENVIVPETVVQNISQSVQQSEPTTATQSLAESAIRVDTSLLDNLMNLAGELVLSRNRIVQLASLIKHAEMTKASQSMSLITTEVQEKIMKTRMQQIGNVFNKFPRVVRDLSKNAKKEIELVMEGSETELDKTILEAIKDPLTHIVRNSVDHGIESPEARIQKGKIRIGKLTLRAYHQGGQVIIEISDDGAGLNIEKIKKKALEKGLISAEKLKSMTDKEAISLIFKPGFSTADQVTNISGRGVGMDVVRTNIEKLGGTVDMQSEQGEGSTIKLKIPLTLAIIPALIVHSCGERFAIPQINLLELVRISHKAIDTAVEKIGDAEFHILRGEILPLIRLSEILNLKPVNGTKPKSLFIAVLIGIGKPFGLIVDGIIDTEEIVVKPLSDHLKKVPFFAGATIMGDGKVALILDIMNLAGSEKLKIDEDKVEEMKGTLVDDDLGTTQQLLLFNVSEAEQFAVPLALVSRLEKIDQKDIEVTGGKEVIRYREASMPIIRLENYIGIAPPPLTKKSYVIVFELNNQKIGFYASKILDTTEVKVILDKETFERQGLLGSTIIDKKITLLLDVFSIIEIFDSTWFTRKRKSTHKDNKLKQAKILVVDDDQFWKVIIQTYLESEKYSIISAENGEEALERLKTEHVDLVVTDLSMPVMDGFELTRKIRIHDKFKNLPIIAVTNLTDEEDKKNALESGIDNYILKLDKEVLLDSVENLLEREYVH